MIIQLHSERIGLFAEGFIGGSVWKCWDDGFDNKHPVTLTVICDVPSGTELGKVKTVYQNYLREILMQSDYRRFRLTASKSLKRGALLQIKPGGLHVWFTAPMQQKQVTQHAV